MLIPAFYYQALWELKEAKISKNIFLVEKNRFLLSKMKSFGPDDVVMRCIAVFLPVRVEKATVNKEHSGNISVCSGGSQNTAWQLYY